MRGSVKGRKKKKNIENERRDKSCWHNVSTIRFAGRRTAFYFCFAPIIDEPCRCFCLTNGRCLCDLALFALHPFTSLRIALRSQCLFSSLSLFFSPSPLYIFFVFLVIFTTDALIKETSKPKPFTPGNALSFLFRPPLRQFSSLTAASFSSRLTFDGRQIGSVLIIQRCPPFDTSRSNRVGQSKFPSDHERIYARRRFIRISKLQLEANPQGCHTISSLLFRITLFPRDSQSRDLMTRNTETERYTLERYLSGGTNVALLRVLSI